jgi:hypothetical protein
MSGGRTRIIGGAGLAVGAAALSYPLLFRHRCLKWGRTTRRGDPQASRGRAAGEGRHYLDPRDHGRGAPGRYLALAGPDGTRPGWCPPTTGSRTSLGLGMHNADQILRQFQDVKVSDEFRPNRPKMRVGILDPEQLFTVECRSSNLLPRASTRRLAASSHRAAPLARCAMLTRPRVPLPFLTGRAAMGASHPCWSRQGQYRAWFRPSASA